MSRNAIYLLLALVVGGAIGTAFYRQHRAQRQLNAQLQELSDLLLADNADAEQAANGAVKGIQAAVRKNSNQPRELAVLAAAERLEQRTDSVVHTLRAHAEKLLLASHNVSTRPTLPHPDDTRAVAELLGHTGPASENLRQQLAALSDTLRALHPGAQRRLAAPVFAGQTVGVALASLAALESDVRAAEADALRHLAPRVGANRIIPHQVALVSAESETVAPGEWYRARLLLVNALGPLPAGALMRCNGQPVPVGPDMLGRVRLVAPQRPGPAAWTGSVRFNANGRDTVFQIRVPYRVARR